jgi:transcriptional regulator with XRE-family HTH domain
MPRPTKYKPKPLDNSYIIPLNRQLAKIRKIKGFTQYSLAETIGISRKQISDYERGLALPNSETVIRLVTALKVSADILLGIKDIEFTASLPNVRFTRRLKDIEQLPEAKKRAIIKILDEFLKPV